MERVAASEENLPEKVATGLLKQCGGESGDVVVVVVGKSGRTITTEGEWWIR